MMLFEKCRQIMKAFIRKYNRKITTNDDVLPKLFDLFHKPTEIRIQFRSTTSKINRFKRRIGCKYIQTQLHGFTCHDLFTIGPCIYMAMFAHLVTHFTNVDLKYFQLSRL